MNYNLDTIQTQMSGLVKFKPDFDNHVIDDTLIGISDSKLYYNQGTHPYITLDNILSMAPRTSGWTIADYDATKTYYIDQVVSYSGSYYYSLIDSNTGNQPDTSTTSWKETTLESLFLRREINGCIDQMLSDVVKAKPLVDHEHLYRIEDTDTTIDNASNYVGFEIRPRDSEQLRVIINAIGVQFSEANSDLVIYLYNQNTKVAEFTVDSLENEFSWNTLSSDNELYGIGKRWFLFYNQDDVNGVAINHDFMISNTVSAYVDIYPFEVSNSTTNFLLDVDGYTNNSYGLGLELTVNCELTDFIVKNKHSFAKLLQLQFAFRMLESFYFNPEARENLSKRNIHVSREELLAEIRSENKNTIVSRLETEQHRVRNSLKFGTVCLPCADESTIYSISNFG
ncbi:MAG: hypothetical protein ACOC10_05000 [Bacteroidota bacterium]